MFQAVKKGSEKLKARVNGDVPWASDVDTIEFLELDAASVKASAEKGEADTRGFRLKGEPIQLEGGADLYNHTAYTVVIDFSRKTNDDTGYLVCFDGSFTLWIGGGAINASVVTDVGERKLRADGVDLVARSWHRLALTFASESGKADLYLDGRLIASTADLKGAVQVGNYFADLFIGSPKGDSFTGRLDNFRFLDRALSGKAIRAL